MEIFYRYPEHLNISNYVEILHTSSAYIQNFSYFFLYNVRGMSINQKGFESRMRQARNINFRLSTAKVALSRMIFFLIIHTILISVISIVIHYIVKNNLSKKQFFK